MGEAKAGDPDTPSQVSIFHEAVKIYRRASHLCPVAALTEPLESRHEGLCASHVNLVRGGIGTDCYAVNDRLSGFFLWVDGLRHYIAALKLKVAPDKQGWHTTEIAELVLGHAKGDGASVDDNAALHHFEQ